MHMSTGEKLQPPTGKTAKAANTYCSLEEKTDKVVMKPPGKKNSEALDFATIMKVIPSHPSRP